MDSKDDDDGKKRVPRFVSVRTWKRLQVASPILICSLCLMLYLIWFRTPVLEPPQFTSNTQTNTRPDTDHWSLDFIDIREMPLPKVASVSASSTANVARSNATNPARLAPLRLEMKLCGDFSQQQFQIISTILVGALLGAQVVLPHNFAGGDLELNWMFDVDKLQLLSQKIYTEYWCVRTDKTAHGLWCSSTYVPGILTRSQFSQLETSSKASTRRLIDEIDISQIIQKLKTKNQTNSKIQRGETGVPTVDIPRVGEEIWRAYFPSGFMENMETEMIEHFVAIKDVKHGCHLYKHLRVSEPDVAYRLFWAIYDALEFNSEIYTILRHLKMNLAQHFAELANDRAMSLGYSTATQVDVVVLEVSQDHCKTNSRDTESTDSLPCFDIGNTLLSEGVPPSSPVYLRSAKSYTEFNGTVLDSIYSLVTKNMLVNLASYFHNSIIWSAVEFLLAADAISVIGLSSSMFSSLMLLARHRLDKAAFHYDGEMTLLEAEQILSPAKSTAVEIFRYPIKWVFSLGKSQQPSTAWNMSLAAVKSASMADVVPVCLTDAGPESELVQVLLKLGVRVLHHIPKWEEKSKVLLNQWRAKSERKWVFTLPKFADIRGMLMRIDIPIVGLLDRFVLYADIDIIFQRAVSWETMLRNSTPLLFTERNITYARPGTLGLPQFFAMSAELVKGSDREKMDTGVMLMNLVNLRKTHQEFISFLFDNKTWKYSTSDPVRYKAYYRHKGKIAATFLPYTMNWKVFWDRDPSQSDSDHSSEPTIVHFHGPKCETGIQPFLSEGIVQHESFRPLLEKCISLDSKCFQYCRQYEWFLFEAYKSTKLSPGMWFKASKSG